MDNFQSIGLLVTEARNLLDSIKGGAIRAMQNQFDALKAQFTDKLGAVSSELNVFVQQQKANVNTIFTDPDNRYSRQDFEKFTVGGDWDTFYPVFIPLQNGRLNEVQLYRPDVYENNDALGLGVTGTFSLLFRGIAGRWGQSAPILSVDFHHHSHYQFVANVVNDTRLHGVFVWLRGGGVSYYLANDSLLKPLVVKASIGSGFVEGAIYEAGYSDDKYGVFMPTKDIDANLPVNTILGAK